MRGYIILLIHVTDQSLLREQPKNPDRHSLLFLTSYVSKGKVMWTDNMFTVVKDTWRSCGRFSGYLVELLQCWNSVQFLTKWYTGSMETFLDYSGIFLLPNISIENLTDVDGYYFDDDGDVPPVDLSPETIIVPVLYFLIVTGGVITNSAALTSIYRRRNLSSASDTYLASHFIGNIVFLSVFVPFIAIAYGITDWVFGGFACKCPNTIIKCMYISFQECSEKNCKHFNFCSHSYFFSHSHLEK